MSPRKSRRLIRHKSDLVVQHLPIERPKTKMKMKMDTNTKTQEELLQERVEIDENRLQELAVMFSQENVETDRAHVYYSSVQYEKFSLLAINRPVDDRRVAKLVDAVENGFDYFHLYPAIVNSNFQVMDGQHRLMAATMTRRRFYYIIDDNFRMEDAARAVSLTKNWTMLNYTDSYAARKFPDYELLKSFRDTYSWLPISFSIRLCSSKGYKAATFNHGHYKADRMGFAREFAEMHKDYMERYTFVNTVPFLDTLINLTGNPEYDHRKMIKKLDLLPTRFKRQATVEAYLTEMTDIYNSGRRDDNRVYFIDRYRRGKNITD